MTIYFLRKHFISLNFLRYNFKVWYRLMFLKVYLHTLLHTCCAQRFMISTPKFNTRNFHTVLVTASGRKRRNVLHRCYIFPLNFIIFDDLLQGYKTRGQPGCVMRPEGSIVIYKYTIRITQLFKRLSILLILIFTKKKSANKLTITPRFLRDKKVGHPCHTWFRDP